MEGDTGNNNFLLKDNTYIQIVKYTISDVKKTYAANNSDETIIRIQYKRPTFFRNPFTYDTRKYNKI